MSARKGCLARHESLLEILTDKESGRGTALGKASYWLSFFFFCAGIFLPKRKYFSNSCLFEPRETSESSVPLGRLLWVGRDTWGAVD